MAIPPPPQQHHTAFTTHNNNNALYSTTRTQWKGSHGTRRRSTRTRLSLSLRRAASTQGPAFTGLHAFCTELICGFILPRRQTWLYPALVMREGQAGRHLVLANIVFVSSAVSLRFFCFFRSVAVHTACLRCCLLHVFRHGLS